MNDTYVLIVRIKDGAYVKKMGPMSESRAEKVSMGALMRIDTERFFVADVSESELKDYPADAGSEERND